MSQINRIGERGRVDRSKPIIIRFNGQAVPAYEGDTVASALLANGIVHVGRSFKYHRPRGILTAGSDEPNGLLDIDRGGGRRDPNNRATVVEAFDGIVARSQNHWPSLSYDAGVVNDGLAPLFAAGFYYKTFMWPRSFWHRVYEPVIRRAAGLGKAPSEPDPDRYVHQYLHCDVLVVGAGPAGISAARAAAEKGRHVVLCDEQSEPGGSLLHNLDCQVQGQDVAHWTRAQLGDLAERDNVQVLTRTTAFGYFNHNFVALCERLTDHLRHSPEGLARERLWQVRAGQVVLATGAHERPLVFAQNDRPGIMLADAMRTFINRYGVTPGRNVIVVTTNDSAYACAVDAKSAGLFVTVVDTRSRDAIGGAERERAARAGIEIIDNHTVLGSTGRGQVTGLIVAPITASGGVGDARSLSCTAVAMSGGWTPSVHLFSQSRGRLTFDDGLNAFVPDQSRQKETSAGACRGVNSLEDCVADGHAAGLEAAGEATVSRPEVRAGEQTGDPVNTYGSLRVLPTNRDTARERAFVDFQNDVTAKDIRLAVKEGFHSVEHVKRYTTTGMATDQGKTSNMNALGLVAGELKRAIEDVGTTTFRLPYTPTTFGAFAGQNRGDLFDPERVTPMHDWAQSHNAVFEDVGAWKRAWYFPKRGESMDQAVQREAKAVRDGVGIFDASTLGKIEVVGPDAAQFLNLIYTNAWAKLAPGRCRYGLMLKEDGFIFDDGVVARIADDRFHVTTTTGGAPRVLAHMEDYLQTEFPDLDVFLTSTTEQWAVIAVQGPRARAVLEPLVEGVELDDTFGHMAMRVCKICGVPCRLFRVSFTGELGFEINVPADFGEPVWEALMEVGNAHGITPYGTETMHLLRAEKGFIIVGQDTDGTVTPDDVGLSGLVSKKKSDFVGKRSLARPDLVKAGRRQLVGLFTSDPNVKLDEGAQIVQYRDDPLPMQMLGHVTSSYMSPNCQRSIALALLTDGRSRKGALLYATTRDGFAEVQVTDTVFIDREGGRLRA